MSDAEHIARLNAALRGRYRIDEELAEGGMATVYLARDPRHDRDVALKVLRPELTGALGSERFRDEIRITANLQHPHILPLFDSGEVEGSLYFVMPHVAGDTLRTKLQREGRLGIEESVGIAESVAAALDYAHRRNVIHRDVKPDNVMLSDGLALVLDFGIASAVEAGRPGPSDRGATTAGTPWYMSPEQADAMPVDARSDVYALGCLLYEMVTGEPPFTGRTAQSVLAKVLMEPVPSARRLRADLPPEIDSVIRRALAKDPDDRFETAAAMAEALAGRSTRRVEADSIALRPKHRPGHLAVLPFDNVGDEQNEYFSDGITEDITTSVARIGGLRVISSASVAQYRVRTKSVGQIADELGVGTIIDGSVRRRGDQVRIVIRLVDARSDTHLWSKTYERRVEDIFDVQREVAASVARAVRVEVPVSSLRGIEGRGTRDKEAYDIYLRGRFHWKQRATAAVLESIRHYERALERDPRFALAHAGLADANVVLGIYGIRAPQEVFEAARAAAETALDIDRTLAEAHASLACIAAAYDWDWDASEEAFRRAIEAAPSYATARQWLAINLLTPSRRFAEAVAELERAQALDPHSAPIAVSRGIIAFYERDYAEAARELDAATLRHPGFALAHSFLGQCLAAAARTEQALGPLREAVVLSDESSETLASLGFVLATLGHTEEAEDIARRLVNRDRQRYVSPALMAQLELGLGRVGAALDLLERAEGLRAADLVWVGVQPVYDTLRDEPRFQALVERVGAPK